MLEVKIYNHLGVVTAAYTQDNCEEFDFVSLINAQTHGPPALVAPFKGEPPTAKVEDRVLYINTSLVPMFSIERLSDR